MCEKPYIETEVRTIEYRYNPKYGDDRMCTCGHAYYRHFDSYDNMENVGCKYCYCNDFVEGQPRLGLGSIVRFNEKVFAEPHAPFYDAYRGHTFCVMDFDYTGDHIELCCSSDPTIKVKGFVHANELEIV